MGSAVSRFPRPIQRARGGDCNSMYSKTAAQDFHSVRLQDFLGLRLVEKDEKSNCRPKALHYMENVRQATRLVEPRCYAAEELLSYDNFSNSGEAGSSGSRHALARIRE